MGTYRLPLGDDPEGRLERLKQAAWRRGVHIQGTVEGGTFWGRGLEGHYHREDQEIVVTIVRLPPLISESRVIEELRKFME